MNIPTDKIKFDYQNELIVVVKYLKLMDSFKCNPYTLLGNK